MNVYNPNSQMTGAADLYGFEASLVYKASTFTKNQSESDNKQAISFSSGCVCNWYY